MLEGVESGQFDSFYWVERRSEDRVREKPRTHMVEGGLSIYLIG